MRTNIEIDDHLMERAQALSGLQTKREAVEEALITVPATRPRRVDKRSAVHQRRRGIRWTALALVHPTAGTMIKAVEEGLRPSGLSGPRGSGVTGVGDQNGDAVSSMGSARSVP